MSEELIWHSQQEYILKRWGEIGSSYRFMHDRAFLYYEQQNFRFALPVIVISTVTGTANFAQSSFPSSWQPYVPLFAGFLNLTAGLVTTIAQFLRVSELLEGHRSASIAYSKFSRNIAVELSLPSDERSCGGREFIANCRLDLDRLIEQTPNIPLHIVKLFGKKFKGTAFVKPDILEITGVEVYKDDEKIKLMIENREMEKRDMEIKRSKEKKRYEDDLIEKVRNEEKQRGIDFENKLTERINKEKKNLKNIAKLKKVEKKKKIGLGSITKSMSSLMKSLEGKPDDSSEETSDSVGDETSDCADDNVSDGENISSILSVIEENEVIVTINDPDTIKDIDFSDTK